MSSTPSPSPERYFPTAVKAAKEAGKLLMEYFGKLKQSDIERKGRSDYVSKVDRMSEEIIIDIIKAEFPGHAVDAEEGGVDHKRNAAFRWVVDPLDGTTNYLHGFPMFCISIAMAHEHDWLLGVVYDPLRDELFWAQKGLGTWINRDQVKVSEAVEFKDALVTTGFPIRHGDHVDPYLESFRRVLQVTGGVRRAGAAALDLAYVASSRADGFWEFGLSPWDMAAGALLVKEAGGLVTDFFGGDNYLGTGHIVAGVPEVHRQLVAMTAEVFKGKA